MTVNSDIRFDDAFLVVPESGPPDYSRTIELLNELYIAESRSFFRYLESWKPYTNAKTIQLRSVCRKMMQESFDHADRLAKLIESLGGVTITGAYSKENSHANYTGWVNLLPRFIDTKQDMIARGEVVLGALQSLPGGPSVSGAVKQMLEENRTDLAVLKDWAARLPG